MLDNPIAWAALICFLLGLALPGKLVRLAPRPPSGHWCRRPCSLRATC